MIVLLYYCGSVGVKKWWILINLYDATTVGVELPVTSVNQHVDKEELEFAVWTLEPQDVTEPRGRISFLNGQELQTMIDVNQIDPNTFLTNLTIPAVKKKVQDGIVLPPISISFVCYNH